MCAACRVRLRRVLRAPAALAFLAGASLDTLRRTQMSGFFERWARLREPLSFADGSLTANGRVRREVVVQRHASLLDSIYGQAIAS